MKKLLVLLSMWTSAGYSQCADVYGKRATCPTTKDSLAIYNNATKVYDFYNNNTNYILVKTKEIISDFDKAAVFNNLKEAKKMFFVIRKQMNVCAAPNKNAAKLKLNKKYKDINYLQYFDEVDEHRFYQREIENQIINIEAPITFYDDRIAPLLVNEYKCIDSTNIYYGDIVNIPMYVPVVIKPYNLLTPVELALRNKLLHIEVMTITSNSIETETKYFVIDESTESKIISGMPVYFYNENGSGSIVGFLKNRRFRKLKPHEYAAYVVSKSAQAMLQDDERFKKWIKQMYGDYCTAFN